MPKGRIGETAMECQGAALADTPIRRFAVSPLPASSDFGLVWASGMRIQTALFNELSKFVPGTASTRATVLKESFKCIDGLGEAASADRYGVGAFFGVSRL